MEAISLLELPSASKRRTCCSRGLGQPARGSVSFGVSGESCGSVPESDCGRAGASADSYTGSAAMYNACRTRAVTSCVLEVWNLKHRELLRSATERVTRSKVRVDMSENSSPRTTGWRSIWEWN